MKNFRFQIAVFIFATLAFPAFAVTYKKVDTEICPVDRNTFKRIQEEVRKKNPDAISSLSDCLRFNHKIVFQAAIIDPSQLAKAEEVIRGDENFVFRLLKIHPEILQYTTDDLRKNKAFLERAIYVNRDSLQYADPLILNNILFMQEMIEADSRNYMYASNRVKTLPQIAKTAFQDNGLLLMYAPAEVRRNKDLVKIAIKSNISAFDYVDESLREDADLLKIIGKKPPRLSKYQLEKFLRKTYVKEFEQKNIGLVIDKNKSLYAKKHREINRNYISKWQRITYFDHHGFNETMRLIPADDRNSEKRWKADLKEHPELIKKIERFFKLREVDQDTIDNLYLSYLWKIKNKPLTFALHLYLLRENKDAELGDQYVNVTSLTLIAQKDASGDWRLSVVEVIFDSEILVNVTYEDGHKQYVLQDLYFQKGNKNPWLIFRVEDKFREYFEIYEEQKGNKYQMIYRLDPLKAKK